MSSLTITISNISLMMIVISLIVIDIAVVMMSKTIVRDMPKMTFLMVTKETTIIIIYMFEIFVVKEDMFVFFWKKSCNFNQITILKRVKLNTWRFAFGPLKNVTLYNRWFEPLTKEWRSVSKVRRCIFFCRQVRHL